MGRSALSLMASLSCVCVLGAGCAACVRPQDASGRDWLSSRHHADPGGVRSHRNLQTGHDDAVSGPVCRLRCRPTALAPPNRLLRKLLAAEGLLRAARHQARNPRGPRPLGHARPPTRTRRHPGAASHRARYAGEACSGSNSGSIGSSDRRSDTRTPYGLLSLHYPKSAGLQHLGRHPAAESGGGAATGRRRSVDVGWARRCREGRRRLALRSRSKSMICASVSSRWGSMVSISGA